MCEGYSDCDGELIEIVRAVRTCAGAPDQWDAWDSTGKYYYLRYRHNKGTIEGPFESKAEFWKVPIRERLIAGFIYEGVMTLEKFSDLAGFTLSEELDVSDAPDVV